MQTFQVSKPAQFHLGSGPLIKFILFVLQVWKGFNKNNGFMMAGAIAYNALLSLIPLLILSILLLSHWIAKEELLQTMGTYVEWLVPSQSKALLHDVSTFFDDGISASIPLIGVMLFFGSMTFSSLDKAMSTIFNHRETVITRAGWKSWVIPYICVAGMFFSLLILTLASIQARNLNSENFSMSVSMIGWFGEVIILTAIYHFLPAGRIPFRHALLGGVSAAFLWEGIRHILFWYFSGISKASVVYGSLTTAVIVLFSLEILAILLLIGAQVIAESEKFCKEEITSSIPD